jgi:hypothetical protein
MRRNQNFQNLQRRQRHQQAGQEEEKKERDKKRSTTPLDKKPEEKKEIEDIVKIDMQDVLSFDMMDFHKDYNESVKKENDQIPYTGDKAVKPDATSKEKKYKKTFEEQILEQQKKIIEKLERKKELLRAKKSKKEKMQKTREDSVIDYKKLTHELLKELLPKQTMNIGSVSYGLPTVALTRRTLDTSIRSKQLELINNRMIHVLSRPAEYVAMGSPTIIDEEMLYSSDSEENWTEYESSSNLFSESERTKNLFK